MHEILTVQLGHRANYVATHFWNTQESYFTYDPSAAPSPVDHDIHFRPGIGANGQETFTPRTLIYDLKGGFGGLRKWGGLYDQQLGVDDGAQPAKNDVWNGNVVLQQDPQIQQSDYQRGLDEGGPQPQTLGTDTVRYWSDFNRVYYHPRSIVQIHDYELGSSLMPFERWESGEELFTNIDREDDVLDRDLRPWAEECDQLQGMQIVTGADDAWGGFAARYAERLRDEFGKLGIWVWGIEEEQRTGKRVKQLLRTVNAARTLHDMSTCTSMYVPLSIPATPLPKDMRLDRTSQWQTSALLSAALETMTLPSRLRPAGSKRGFLDDLEAALNVNGNQRIARLQCSVLGPVDEIPSPRVRGAADERVRSSTNDAPLAEDIMQAPRANLDIDLSGADGTSSDQRNTSNHVFGAVECLRGKVEERGEDADEDDVADSRKRRRFAGLPVMESYRTTLAYPVLNSFPSIFSPSARSAESVSLHTSLTTSTRISSRIKLLQKTSGNLVGVEERETLVNGLAEIGGAYEEGWESGSDEDSD